MKKRLILYTGYFHFPEGDVAATRVLGIGKALRAAGYDVVFAGAEEHSRDEDRTSEGTFRYAGFTYTSLGEWQRDKRTLWSRLIRYLSSGQRVAQWLRQFDLDQVAAVIVYNGLTAVGLRVQRVLREAKVPLVMDVTEWHDARHYPGGRFGLHRWDVSAAMRLVNVRAGNVIAISSYLERFYKERGAEVLRVPPLLDLNDRHLRVEKNQTDANCLRIAYAGSPGQKDGLREMLQAMLHARAAGVNLQFNVVGSTREQITRLAEDSSKAMNELGSDLVIHGRFPTRQGALDVLRSMDALMLIKRPGRSAEAQFPTKLAEYFALGRPVIANRTGDVAEHVHDGINGILIEGTEPKDIAGAIQRLALQRDHWQQMSAAARTTAAVSFDFHNYVAPLSAFMQRVVEHV